MLPYFVNVTNFPWNHSTLAFLDCKWHVTKEVSGMAKMKNHRFLSILFNFPQQILYRFDRLSFVIFWPLASLGKIQTSFSKHRRYWVRRYTMLLSSHMHHTRKTTADAEKPLLRTRRGSQFAGGLRSGSQLLFFSRETLSVSKLEFARADLLVLREKKSVFDVKSREKRITSVFDWKFTLVWSTVLDLLQFLVLFDWRKSVSFVWKKIKVRLNDFFLHWDFFYTRYFCTKSWNMITDH